MIRRAVIVVLMLGISLLVLHLTIGLENFANADQSGGAQPIRETDSGQGVIVGGVPGDSAAPISMSGRGRFEYTRSASYEFPGGETRFLPRFEVVALDSETVADDLLRLDDVEVKVFRIEEGEAPRAIHIATIHAREAFVQVGRDEKGNPSIREDRDMDLTGVRLESTADARVHGLSLAVEHLRVRQTEAGMKFETPDQEEAFHVQLGGDQPVRLEGHGLSGFVPSREAVDGQLELHVHSHPVLVRSDLELSADGPFDYLEDLRTGFGHIETNRNVEIRGFGITGVEGDAIARGETLSGTLMRSGGESNDSTAVRSGGTATWGRLILRGSQARLVAEPIELRCDELSVAPAIDGKPAMFTAIGDPSITDHRAGTTFRAAERIHLIDVPAWLGALHRDAGFGMPRFPDLVGQLVVFEGAARIVEAERGFEITASDGLRVLRSAKPAGPLLAVGRGTVQVKSADLLADGDDGFELRQSATGQVLRLGPAQPSATHHYRIERSDGDVSLVVSGTGASRLVRGADGSADVHLESTTDDVVLTRGDDRLDGVRSLDAKVGAGGDIEGLTATGSRCHVVARTNDKEPPIDGHAARIESADGRAFVLTGTDEQPATITRAASFGVTAPGIDLRPVGERRLWLVARGGAKPAHVSVRGRAEDAALPADGIDLDANTVVFAPAVVPDLVLRAHGVPRLGSIAAEHVFAKGHVTLVEREPESGAEVAHANGDSFLLAVRSARGALRGKPAEIETVTDGDRRVIGRADDVRFAAAPDGRGVLRLLQSDRFDPELDLHGRGGGPFRDVRIVCAGSIEALPDHGQFGGPVHAQGLTPSGDLDPGGLDFRAESLDAEWDQTTRELRTIVARGKPRVRVNDIVAFGDKVRVDVPRTTMQVWAGSDALATVEVRGSPTTGGMFQVDYESRRVQAWRLQRRTTSLDR